MKKKSFKLTKRLYLTWFVIAVAVLALLRVLFPQVAGSLQSMLDDGAQARADSLLAVQQLVDKRPEAVRFTLAEGEKHHRVRGVPDFKEAFPDSNAVQMASARLHGVPPVQNRDEAERRKDELVYIGSNPYFNLRDLTLSIPYLVPSAALLLQDIGRNFVDSLHVKGLEPCVPYVSSVTRTKDDVARLLRQNRNATPNSCHLYGTTFDINYNRFSAGDRDIFAVKLQQTLCEVVADLRRDGRCWVKYERLQPVLHITVR